MIESMKSSSRMEQLANKIDEDIYSQLDDASREILIFQDIIDHRKDDPALTTANGITNQGQDQRN